jgi:hypothetical protein
MAEKLNARMLLARARYGSALDFVVSVAGSEVVMVN